MKLILTDLMNCALAAGVDDIRASKEYKMLATVLAGQIAVANDAEKLNAFRGIRSECIKFIEELETTVRSLNEEIALLEQDKCN